MSVMRNFQSLGDIHGLAENSLANCWVNGAPLDEVDLGNAEYVFKSMLQAEELEQTDRAIELDKDIDITVLVSFISGHGAKQSQRGNAQVTEFYSVRGQKRQCILSLHT